MRGSILIFILFVGFMIIGSFGGIYFNYIGSKQVLTEQTNEYFGTIAQSRANHVGEFLEEHKHMVELLAFSAEYSELDELIKIHSEFYEVFILDKNGKVVATTNPEEEIGEDFSKDLVFLNAKKELYIKDAFYDEEFGKNAIAISTPIFNETKEFSGVFVARMEMSELNEITTDRTGLGETGEIYLINKDGYMISHSRFLSEEHTFLKLKVDTENSRACFEALAKYYRKDLKEVEEHEEKILVFEDYREINVLGTHAHISEMRWCLLAEIGEAEALGELRDKLLKTAFIVLIGIVVVMGVFILLSGYLIEKIIKEAKKDKKK